MFSETISKIIIVFFIILLIQKQTLKHYYFGILTFLFVIFRKASALELFAKELKAINWKEVDDIHLLLIVTI
jgi:hypothetical protein